MGMDTFGFQESHFHMCPIVLQDVISQQQSYTALLGPSNSDSQTNSVSQHPTSSSCEDYPAASYQESVIPQQQSYTALLQSQLRPGYPNPRKIMHHSIRLVYMAKVLQLQLTKKVFSHSCLTLPSTCDHPPTIKKTIPQTPPPTDQPAARQVNQERNQSLKRATTAIQPTNPASWMPSAVVTTPAPAAQSYVSTVFSTWVPATEAREGDESPDYHLQTFQPRSNRYGRQVEELFEQAKELIKERDERTAHVQRGADLMIYLQKVEDWRKAHPEPEEFKQEKTRKRATTI